MSGVLLCTSHRLIFIQYPLSEADESAEAGSDVGIGVVQSFPIASIAAVQVQKKHKGGSFIALQVSCKDSTGNHVCDVACGAQQSTWIVLYSLTHCVAPC